MSAHRARSVRSRPRRYCMVIALDGKAMRAARRIDGRQVHLMSALDTGAGIVLAQVTIDAKSNEIPASTPLLDAVEQVLDDLVGCLIADALHVQTDQAHQVHRRGVHLAVQVKGDQPTFTRQLKPPGRRSRSATRPAKPAMAPANPQPSGPSPHKPRAGSGSPTPKRRQGHPHPHPRFQDQPRNLLPGHLDPRRRCPIDRAAELDPQRVAHRELTTSRG